MSYKVTTAATAEPLELAFVKSYLKVDFEDEDDYILVLIKNARDIVEQYTSRTLMLQTVEKSFDCFPDAYSTRGLELESAPVESVEAITYLDTDGSEQTWDGEDYRVIVRQDITVITPKNRTAFPTTYVEADAVTVEYKLGYPSADEVPGAFIQAMLLIIGKMYENREDSIKNMPSTSETLLSPYKIFQ